MYIVIDDIGFGWIEPFGGRSAPRTSIASPEGGLRYTHFTTTALCSPTRSALLTGRNHHSVGMANIPELASGFPGYNGRQPQNKAGIGAMLHDHGYTSFCVGKWHNTPSEETGISGPYDRWPTGSVFGFDRFYGFLGGDSDQWFPKLFIDREAIDQPRLPEDGYHLSEDLAERTMSWLAQHKSLAPRQAVAGLPRVRGDARAAPHLAGVGGPLQGPVRRRLGCLPRGGDRPAEGDGHRPRQAELSPDAGGRPGVGQPLRRRAPAVRPHGRGLRRLHGAHRRADRSARRLPRARPASSTTPCCSSSSATTAARARAPSTACSTSRASRSSRASSRNRSSETSLASTSSACPAPTTTTRWAGPSPATPPSGSASSTPTGAASGTR